MSSLIPVITTEAVSMPSFSQGIIANGFVFTSGQVGLDPQTGRRPEDFEVEVDQVIANLEAILLAAGSGLHCVVKTLCVLSDMTLLPQFNVAYDRRFLDPRPARSTIAASLAADFRVEIECVATIA